jgi:ferredoxin
MAEQAYYDLRDILHAMPNGFPSTEDELEIRLLEKIYEPDEAELATKLKMKYETVDLIAERTELDKAFLAEKLHSMSEKGQIMGVKIGDIKIYKLMPFVFGVYEYQVKRIDREMADLFEKYVTKAWGEHFFTHGPALLRVIPVEKNLPNPSVVEPYQNLSNYIETAKSWAVEQCICKKEMKIEGRPCNHSEEVCLGLAPIPNFFDDFYWGRPISKEEAMEILKKCEEEGLVHMTANTREGNIYICNCCGCSCGILRGMNEFGYERTVAESNYRAVIHESDCTGCGICKDRCQVRAIEIDGVAKVNKRCIGCGLCVSSCPADAIKMARRNDDEINQVPLDEKRWFKQRAANRGCDDYKKLL